MKKKYIFRNVLLLLALSAGMYSCTKKVNGVDNNTIIETPYSLFFADAQGAVYKSNDGKAFNNIYQPDGTQVRAICSQFSNIMVVKQVLLVSTNNGQSFSLGNSSISSFSATDCNNDSVTLNESMIINIPSWSRIYCVCNNPSTANYLGQLMSIAGGIYGSWSNFDAIDTFPGGIGKEPMSMVSYTWLSTGVLCGLARDPSSTAGNVYYRNLYKADTETYSAPWLEVTGATPGTTFYVAGRNNTGTPLPTNGFFTLGHINGRLVAIDGTCNNGAYYSDDTGRNWYKFSGLPAGTSMLSVCAPFEQSLLVGSSNGLYAYDFNTNSFQLNSNGLTDGIRVNGIAYKQNVYVSGGTQQFVYLATNKGIYQSTDGGTNWLMTIPGNFTCIY